MKKRTKILIISAGALLLLIAAAFLMVITSKSDLYKQQGGIRDSAQTYEYYQFEGHTFPIYNRLLSLNYNWDYNEEPVSNTAYMALVVNDGIAALPDDYLYSNYSDFNVSCEVTENDYQFLKLKFSGMGTSNSGEVQNIDFDLIVDWYEVYLHGDDSIYLA